MQHISNIIKTNIEFIELVYNFKKLKKNLKKLLTFIFLYIIILLIKKLQIKKG